MTTLTLNRPRQFNALSSEMIAALQHAVDGIGDEKDPRGGARGPRPGVLRRARSQGKCASHPERDWQAALFARCSALMSSLLALPHPGDRSGAGLGDRRRLPAGVRTPISRSRARRARFAVSGIDVGLFCSTPAVPLSRNLSRKRAFEMLFTGEFVSAATAVEWGLLNRAVPAAELDAAVEALAATIRGKSAVAVRTGKGLFYEQLERPLSEAYALAGTGDGGQHDGRGRRGGGSMRFARSASRAGATAERTSGDYSPDTFETVPSRSVCQRSKSSTPSGQLIR